MSWVLHQNLENFGGGGAREKIDLLHSTFIDTVNNYGPTFEQPVDVIGFTEVTNDSTVHTVMPGLLERVFRSDQLAYRTINCGRTSGSKKVGEFIVIGWNTARVNVVSYGTVMTDCTTGDRYGNVFVVEEFDARTDRVISGAKPRSPDANMPDARGYAFIRTDQNSVFGFIHNMCHAGCTVRYYANLDLIGGMLAVSRYADCKNPERGRVILGGDFNALPPEPPREYMSGGKASPWHACGQRADDGSYIKTAQSGCIDWWYTNDMWLDDRAARVGAVIKDPADPAAGLGERWFPSNHCPVLLKYGRASW